MKAFDELFIILCDVKNAVSQRRGAKFAWQISDMGFYSFFGNIEMMRHFRARCP